MKQEGKVGNEHPATALKECISRQTCAQPQQPSKLILLNNFSWDNRTRPSLWLISSIPAHPGGH